LQLRSLKNFQLEEKEKDTMNSRDGLTPATDETNLENKIQEKGLTAPRVTPALIDSKIKNAEYHVFPKSCLTICCITLANGFTVTGESACASPENFNKEIGEEIAFRNARDKIWSLEGYLLKEKLAAA
jgi:hypothetical protein